jgi:alanine racemase
MSFPSALIDSAALRNNLAAVRRMAPASRILAVIKANAYGHGIVPVARALSAADALGVARLEEGLALREAGIDSELVLLEGIFSHEQLQAAARHGFELVVHSFEQLEMLEACPGPQRFVVWVKCDTGMNRLGFRPDDFIGAMQRIRRSPCVARVRLMTHLASAEERASATAALQIAEFRALTDELAGDLQLERSVANSAGLIAWPDARLDWVRPGLMLYGISPIAGTSAAALGLRPAMTLTTQLIALRRTAAGETVGYNGIWRAPRDSLIGIAAVGYGDGYPRNMRSGAPVLVNGNEAPIVGRVSMDMIAIDLTDAPDAKVADSVTLWGRGLPIERIAPYADTITYELVCGISQRVAVQWE